MSEESRKKVGAKLKEVRLEKGLTQKQLAEKSGFASNYIAMVERGEKSLTVSALEKITDALGVKSSTILPF